MSAEYGSTSISKVAAKVRRPSQADLLTRVDHALADARCGSLSECDIKRWLRESTPEGRVAMAKYGKKASDKVEEEMHELKRGRLKSASGKKVTSRKQAIAIGLSEARREGDKVPRRSRPA